MSALTIGEVLNRLKEEFEDITISKIRFLESEGLVSPDRTDSGYRQFRDKDVERLRYILRTQRDRYLPLKVIREELERLDAGEPVEPRPPPPPPVTPEAEQPDEPVDASAGTTDGPDEPTVEPHEVDLTLDELSEACGLSIAQLRALREHGVLEDGDRFDGHDLVLVRAAAELISLGLEPRHLRMYRQFADREAALYDQLISPLLRQRNPESRRRAADQARGLAGHGRELHAELLARELRRSVGT